MLFEVRVYSCLNKIKTTSSIKNVNIKPTKQFNLITNMTSTEKMKIDYNLFITN